MTWPSDDGPNKSSGTDVFGIESDAKRDEYVERCVPFHDRNQKFNVSFSLMILVRSFFLSSVDKSDEWDQAETLMSNYRTILERREHLHSEVASMGLQNKELKKELESKLKQKINEQLVFPPRDLIS